MAKHYMYCVECDEYQDFTADGYCCQCGNYYGDEFDEDCEECEGGGGED